MSYRILATNYESMGEIEKSSDMYSKMVNIAEANKDTGALANIYSMLAMQEARLGLKESAFEHAETGLKYYMRDTANLDNVASANEYYSSVHETFDSYEEAYLKLKEASKIRKSCLLYTSPSPRDLSTSRMPSSA